MAKGRANTATNKIAAEARRRLFVQHYLKNGRNATQAAISAGYSPKTARSQGQRLLTYADIAAAVDKAVAKYEAITGLSVETTLREVARLQRVDPRRYYDADGCLLPVGEWDDDMAAAVAQIESEELFEGQGKDRRLIGYTKKLKFWDKGVANNQAMKHLGLYEKDNRQQGTNLAIQINLVDAPAPKVVEGEVKR